MTMKCLSAVILSLFLLGAMSRVAYSDDEVVLVGADMNDIAREALALVQQTQHTQPGEEMRIFPGLASFNCPGSISSILVIADSNTSSESSITLSFWKPSDSVSGRFLEASQGDSREVARKDIELISSSGNIALYRAALSSPLEFTSGELLGIREGGLALQYIYRQGPENFVFIENTNNSGVFMFAGSPVAAVRDLPLLTLENFNCGGACGTACVDHFFYDSMDLEQFIEMNTNSKVLTPFLGSPTTSPLLRFTNDGVITRWSVNGRLGSDQPPELEIWRLSGTGANAVYQIVQGTTAEYKDAVSETKTFVTQEILFREGDVLGVSYLGRQRVELGEILLSPDGYSGSGSGDAKTDYKSGVIEISLAVDLDISDGGSESDQSIAEPVISKEALFSNTHSDMEYTTFPQFSIPVGGHLKRWLFAAQVTPLLRPDQRDLQLQVWREAPNILMQTFRLVHSTNVSVNQGAVPGGSLGTWEVIIQELLAVEPGDILGFHQPPTELRLALLNGSKTAAHELTLLHAADPFLLTRSRGNTEQETPLMAVEILPDPKPSPSPTATPTVAVTTEDEPLLSRDETITTATVSVAVVIVGAVLVGLILLYSCKKLCYTETRLQHKSSLYYTVQKPQLENSLSSHVYLRSHHTTPEPDNEP